VLKVFAHRDDVDILDLFLCGGRSFGLTGSSQACAWRACLVRLRGYQGCGLFLLEGVRTLPSERDIRRVASGYRGENVLDYFERVDILLGDKDDAYVPADSAPRLAGLLSAGRS
jgi:hypothetical protein